MYSHHWLFHFFYINIFISRYWISIIYPCYFFLFFPFSFSLFSETFIACEKTIMHFPLTRSDFDFVPVSTNYWTSKENLFYIIIVFAYIFLSSYFTFRELLLQVVFFLRYIRCRFRSMFQQMLPVATSLYRGVVESRMRKASGWCNVKGRKMKIL